MSDICPDDGARPPNVLCLASYEKDHRFLTEGKKLGWRVYLMTSARLRDAGWPRDSVDHILFMPGDQVLKLFGLNDGALNTEFIRSRDTGELCFLETPARVGEAHIPELTEAGTGANLWSEWAKLESSLVTGLSYFAPEVRHNQAGLLVSWAQQEWPDTSVFSDPEVVWKVAKRHHVGLVVSSPDCRRVARTDGFVYRDCSKGLLCYRAPSRKSRLLTLFRTVTS